MKCHFTQEEVTTIDPQSLAITYSHGNSRDTNNSVTTSDTPKFRCGHESHLSSLVSYLYEGNTKNNRSCPYCDEIITEIYDGITNDAVIFMMKKCSAISGDETAIENINIDMGSYDLVSFKYGRHNYHLSLSTRQNSKNQLNSISESILAYCQRFLFQSKDNSEKDLAQDRIAGVLGMDESHMKILYRGKLLFPNKDASMTARDVSRRLVEISMLDFQEQHQQHLKMQKRRQKHQPSLVVMGTRRTDMERAKRFTNAGDFRHKNTFNGQIRYYLYFGLINLIGFLRTLIGGTILLFKTVLPNGRIIDDETD